MAKQQLIIYDGAVLKLVPQESTDGSLLYVSGDRSNAIGCKLYPDGRLEQVNATPTTCSNCKIQSDANRQQRYLQFKHALGHNRGILVSHAVYLAWSEEGYIPEGFEIDHLNGITTDNCILNLEAVSKPENRRRQACSKKLVASAIQPKHIFYRNLRGIMHLTDEQFEYWLSHVQELFAASKSELTIESINLAVAEALDDVHDLTITCDRCGKKMIVDTEETYTRHGILCDCCYGDLFG